MRLKIIAVVNEGAKVLHICTTLIGLPDLASDGLPLFSSDERRVTLQFTAC